MRIYSLVFFYSIFKKIKVFWRTLYKSVKVPVLLYGAETWTLTSSAEQALGVFERKTLRKIYGPFCVRGEWRIRWNQVLYNICDDIDVVKHIKLQRLRWMVHVLPMDSSNPVRNVFEPEPGGGSRRVGRPRQLWAHQVTV